MLNIGVIIGLIKGFLKPVKEELTEQKNALTSLGLTVADGKLCITVEDDTEEEGE